jgi:hypothetical protein
MTQKASAIALLAILLASTIVFMFTAPFGAASSNPSIRITIDGNFGDWTYVPALLTDPVGDKGYYLDITSAYATDNDTNLFLLVNYAKLDEGSSVMANITLRTDTGALYLIMAFSDTAMVTGATSLTEDCKDQPPPVYTYPNSVASSADGSQLELGVSLVDIGSPTVVDLVFWTNMPSMGVAYDRAPNTDCVMYLTSSPNKYSLPNSASTPTPEASNLNPTDEPTATSILVQREATPAPQHQSFPAVTILIVAIAAAIFASVLVLFRKL